jgi:hypothetical protein
MTGTGQQMAFFSTPRIRVKKRQHFWITPRYLFHLFPDIIEVFFSTTFATSPGEDGEALTLMDILIQTKTHLPL